MTKVVHLPIAGQPSREVLRSRRKREVRSHTISVKRMTKREIAMGRLLHPDSDDVDAMRPQTRADCADVPRPCPFVACKYNLYLDVSDNTGAIKLNFPDLQPEEMSPTGSCALDVADRGAATLEIAGELMNLTRERIRQVDAKALRKVAMRAPTLAEFADDPDEAKGHLRQIRNDDLHGGWMRRQAPMPHSERATRLSHLAVAEPAPEPEELDDSVLPVGDVWDDLDKGKESPARHATASFRAYRAYLRSSAVRGLATDADVQAARFEHPEMSRPQGGRPTADHPWSNARSAKAALEKEKAMPRGITEEKFTEMEQRRSNILSLLQSDGPQTGPALLAATKLTKGELSRVLAFLKDANAVVQEGIKRQAFYRLPSQEGFRPRAFTKPSGAERRRAAKPTIAAVAGKPRNAVDHLRALREEYAGKINVIDQAIALLGAS